MTILLNDEDYDPRINALIDDRLFKVFWDAVQHFGSKDLVLFFDQTEPEDPVSVLPRERVVEGAALPALFKKKVSRPACDAAVKLTASDTAFWLVVHYTEGDGACVAVNAKPIAPGGNA